MVTAAARLIRRYLPVIGVGCFLGACGSASGASATSATSAVSPTPPIGNLAPCTILSKADAEAALGKPVQAGHADPGLTDPAAGNSCTYLAAGAGAAGSVSLAFFSFPDSDAAQAYLARLKGARSQAQTVAGIGQAAFFLPSGPGSGTLIFRIDATLAQIGVSNASSDDALMPLQDLARTVAGQI